MFTRNLVLFVPFLALLSTSFVYGDDEAKPSGLILKVELSEKPRELGKALQQSLDQYYPSYIIVHEGTPYFSLKNVADPSKEADAIAGTLDILYLAEQLEPADGVVAKDHPQPILKFKFPFPGWSDNDTIDVHVTIPFSANLDEAFKGKPWLSFDSASIDYLGAGKVSDKIRFVSRMGKLEGIKAKVTAVETTFFNEVLQIDDETINKD